MVGYMGYLTFKSYMFVDTHHIDIQGSTYVHQVSTKPYVKHIATKLTNHCKSDACKIQELLNYVTTIPYKINPSISRSPKNTIKNGYGDCDDKSNLLISMLHSLGYEAYFVLVPGHIFTIVRLDDKRYSRFKGLYLNGKKYFILESTAKMSPIGFGLKYDLNLIKAIVDPFKNEKLEIKDLQWKV
jgi:transglutaminase-like putative cysteine protease